MRLQDLFAEFPTRDWDTNPDGTVRLAVVGLGGYARNVALPAIAAGDYVEVGAVVSGDPEKADAVADRHDARPMGYEAYTRGRYRDRYDAVYVATPNRLHLDHVRAAADQGKAVLAEKPLEATVERAEDAVAACSSAGVTLMTAYRMQTDPVLRRLREFVRDGGVGDPLKLFGDFTRDILGAVGGPDQWRLDADLAGGGALVTLGVYPLNTARFLLEADPVAVSARVRSEGEAFGDTPAGDSTRVVDEHVHFQTEFPDGVVGGFSASFSGETNCTLELVGTDGRVRVDDAYQPRTDRQVSVQKGDRAVEFDGLGVDETVEQFDYFAHCVLTDGTPEPDGRDGLTDLRVVDAVYESAAADRRVDVATRGE